jgi:pyruvate formate lyase activating enzyme
LIAGLQKTSLIDYPGMVSSVVFTLGCNLRCGFCHNPELVIGCPEIMNTGELLGFLKKRRSLIQGVCITGGEPLIHQNIDELISEIKNLGLKVKLDTNGTMPDRFKKITNIDYIAMDIKTSFKRYGELSLDGRSLENALLESAEYILSSGIDHEFRTTVVPGLFEESDLKQILPSIKGAKKYYLSQFRNQIVLNDSYRKIKPFDNEILLQYQKMSLDSGVPCEIR